LLGTFDVEVGQFLVHQTFHICGWVPVGIVQLWGCKSGRDFRRLSDSRCVLI